MALILKKELESGLVIEDSYCKVMEVICTKNSMSFYVGVFVNKEMRELNKAPIKSLNYNCEHNSSNNSYNSIKQAYEYLKTLDEYKSAIDDLEN